MRVQLEELLAAHAAPIPPSVVRLLRRLARSPNAMRPFADRCNAMYEAVRARGQGTKRRDEHDAGEPPHGAERRGHWEC